MTLTINCRFNRVEKNEALIDLNLRLESEIEELNGKIAGLEVELGELKKKNILANNDLQRIKDRDRRESLSAKQQSQITNNEAELERDLFKEKLSEVIQLLKREEKERLNLEEIQKSIMSKLKSKEEEIKKIEKEIDQIKEENLILKRKNESLSKEVLSRPKKSEILSRNHTKSRTRTHTFK